MCLRQVESESEMFSKWRERSRSGKRQLFKFWGKCPSKSADGRGERFMSSGRCRVNLKKRPAFGRKCIHRGTRRHEKQHAPSDH